MIQANQARFSIGALQPEASVTLCPRQRQIAVAKAGQRREAGRKTAGIWRIPVYTSFEDGYHRVVTRIDEDRRRSDPQIPSNANWHSSYIDAYNSGVKRQRHRTFFEHWPDEIRQYSLDTSMDVRKNPHYVVAKGTGALAVTDPIINPDTGYPVIPLAYPIRTDAQLIGVVSAHITMNVLAEFLARHKASPNSITIIADRSGNVIAHPVLAESVRRVDGKVQLAKLSELPEPQVVEAVAQRAARASIASPLRPDRTARNMRRCSAPFPQILPSSGKC